LVVVVAVVPVASKNTANGATPEVRLVTTESAGRPSTGHVVGLVATAAMVKHEVKLAVRAMQTKAALRLVRQ
jgi:hypothetical protein